MPSGKFGNGSAIYPGSERPWRPKFDVLALMPAFRLRLAPSMDTVRLGIVGLGNMGKAHLGNIRAGKVAGTARDRALCESVGTLPPLQEGSRAVHGREQDDQLRAMIDAILICTPHFSHTTIGIEALKAGLHVLVEKPISVHKADCERLIAAHTDKSKIFAAMFNMRTNATFKKVKDLID